MLENMIGCKITLNERKNVMSTPVRAIWEIACDIRADWKKIWFGAAPYLTAMREMDKITDDYGMDSAKSIVLYFLSNATTWRGETARRIKKELNAMVKAA